MSIFKRVEKLRGTNLLFLIQESKNKNEESKIRFEYAFIYNERRKEVVGSIRFYSLDEEFCNVVIKILPGIYWCDGEIKTQKPKFLEKLLPSSLEIDPTEIEEVSSVVLKEEWVSFSDLTWVNTFITLFVNELSELVIMRQNLGITGENLPLTQKIKLVYNYN